ncbi:MAG: hypothetical protein ACLR2G_13045 [Phascolarctobacterium faecium]
MCVCIVAESIGIPIASLLAVLGMLGLAVSLSVQGAYPIFPMVSCC